MKHLLMGVYQVCSNKRAGVKIGTAIGGSLFFPICTWVKIGPAPGVIDLPYMRRAPDKMRICVNCAWKSQGYAFNQNFKRQNMHKKLWLRNKQHFSHVNKTKLIADHKWVNKFCWVSLIFVLSKRLCRKY
jgi:hypothetical protein